jgi:hypothetical protein
MSRPVYSGRRFYAYGGGGPGSDDGVPLHIDQDFVLRFLSDYSPPFPQQLAGEVEQLLGTALP